MLRGFPRFRNRAHAGQALGFRSGLEEKNAEHIRSVLSLPVLFESFKIRYAIPLSWHNYTPDFLLPNGIIVETKGRWLPNDRAKHLLVKEQYPELDIRLVFTRSRTPINQGSKMTCAQWADKFGFKWAEKLVPASWAKEPGPARKPHDVLKGGPKGYG
jgi:Phage endonuclease I